MSAIAEIHHSVCGKMFHRKYKDRESMKKAFASDKKPVGCSRCFGKVGQFTVTYIGRKYQFLRG